MDTQEKWSLVDGVVFKEVSERTDTGVSDPRGGCFPSFLKRCRH